MPRKKKPSQSKKPTLQFLESPQKGEKVIQVVPLQSAVNPRHVSCVPIDQKSSFTWVLPQFEFLDTTVEGPSREQHKCNKSDRTTRHNYRKKQNTTLKAVAERKLCNNFVPLTFLGCDELPVQKENHKFHSGPSQKVETLGQAQLPTNKTLLMGITHQAFKDDSPFGKVQNIDILGQKFKCNHQGSVAKGLFGKMNFVTSSIRNIPHSSMKCSSFSSPLYCVNHQNCAESVGKEVSLSDEDFILPHVSTPTIDSLLPACSLRRHISRVRDRTPDVPTRISFQSRPEDCLDTSYGLNNFSEACLTPEVWVQDTPEHEYGLKAIWRRRPDIMQYLKDRGKLTSSDVLVGK
ncbi:uncharacterized protein LOC132824725 [Hemiscyllium ocellatum]|uniref:uncharacterized protein LOC132824725 n=1 Tax=Hemiscyllium ocellatum TaxID=170820 RepID=UPI002967328E|nr:uncharacterized protein LOC132824725 [Hemiscyllium ocellatum]XP_060695384.1 uncharacterized protein LOC132824725 [Hemiscyllium ocellatum]